MKKTIIAVLVGTFIMFIYQALSWMVLPTHKNSFKYTDKEGAILEAMSGLEEGTYMIPGKPPGRSDKDHMEQMKSYIGKPWATFNYHPSMVSNMPKSMAIGFILNFITIWIFVWLLKKMTNLTRGAIIMAALAVGALFIFNSHLMNWNWMTIPMHHISGEIIDSIVSWLLVGLWIGWYWTRKAKTAAV
ncbi:MAG: hypothetical protein ACHQFW_10400 [Chitinophagales bacterium]